MDGIAENASLIFHKFRYPVTMSVPRLHQQPLDAGCSNDGLCRSGHRRRRNAGEVVRCRDQGWIRNPGPELELDFHVEVQDLPLDGRFRDALDEQGRKVVDSLNIGGLGSAKVDCHRDLRAEISRPIFSSSRRFGTAAFASANFHTKFTGLSGEFSFDSKAKYWRFTNLHGWHDKGELHAGGSFRGLPEPGCAAIDD